MYASGSLAHVEVGFIDLDSIDEKEYEDAASRLDDVENSSELVRLF